MPEGPDGKTIIIVKKVVGHGGHHGGAWKVAYADFVTAMMALFLVLWLVNSASVVTKQAVASYFRRPGVFELGSGTPLQLGGAGILNDTFAPPADENSQVNAHSRIYDTQGEGFEEQEQRQSGKYDIETRELQEISAAIQEAIKEVKEDKGEGALGNVEIKLDQRGLHLEIMDTATASMFASGSAQILPEAEKALLGIAEILHQLPNPIDIEGHTDATPFRGVDYDNWSLSLDRANAARRVLKKAKIDDQQVARVVGYASQRPKVPENPYDASNRRISISMRYTEQAAVALAGTNIAETRSEPISKANEAENKPLSNEPAPVTAPSASGIRVETAASAAPTTAPAPEQQRPDGLRIEVGTSMPEGAVATRSDVPRRRPIWMQKDKIFGDRNPFLPSE